MRSILLLVAGILAASANAEAQKAPAPKPKPQVLCGNLQNGKILTKPKCKTSEVQIGLDEISRFDPYDQCRAVSARQFLNVVGTIELTCTENEFLQTHGYDLVGDSNGLPEAFEAILGFDTSGRYAVSVRYTLGDRSYGLPFTAVVHGVCCDVRY